jgi:hypothetical protein
LAKDGAIARQRRPGGVYAYTIANRFLPAARGVSHQREKGVPSPGREEQADKKKNARPRERFAKREVSYGEMLDDRAKWEARVRSWRQSRFWLPLWGPKTKQLGEALQQVRAVTDQRQPARRWWPWRRGA